MSVPVFGNLARKMDAIAFSRRYPQCLQGPAQLVRGSPSHNPQNCGYNRGDRRGEGSHLLNRLDDVVALCLDDRLGE